MAHSHTMDDATYKSQVRAIWKTTIYLTVVTIIEVGLAILWLEGTPLEHANKFILNSLLIMFSFVKAFFIIAEFMHLKYEKRALIISLMVPLIFIVWAIIAFLWESDSWLNMKGF